MKKILCALFILVLFVAGCGGSDGKKEVQAMHDKYEKLISQTMVDLVTERKNVKDWSKELLQLGQKYQKKFEEIGSSIEAEKATDKVASYKNALKLWNRSIIDTFVLANKQLSAKTNTERQGLTEQYKEVRGNYDQYFYEKENEYSKVINGKPAVVMGINGVNYLAYNSSNVDIAVTKVKREKNAIGNNPYFQKKPLGIFIIVDVFVKNNQKDAITVDSNSFKLIDNQNSEYSISSEAQTALQIGNNNTKGFLTQLNPNMATNFTFVFDVPDTLNSNNTKLKATGGIQGKAVLMPLKAVKVKAVKQ